VCSTGAGLRALGRRGGLELGFEALEAAAVIAQERVEESRDEVARADNPEERERAADKLEQASALRARVEAARLASDEYALLAEAARTIEALNDPLTVDRQVRDYLYDVSRAADAQVREAGQPLIFRQKIIRAAAERLRRSVKGGASVDGAIHQLGPPDRFVANWLDEWPASSM
jgi:hypothetical protein